MNREIENRKKRFLSFCMAFMILLVQVIPVNISAETYDADTDIIQDETFLLPGDIVEYYHSPGVSDTEINYYDADGADGLILLASESNTSDTSESAQFVVKDYDGTQLSAEEFRGWKVTSIYCSSGALGFINLQATSYTSSNISYELDGGENDPSNPSSYYEGKEEIVLADATKDGYTFAGWYTDNAFTNKVTSISTSMTGDITLYAKFLAKYNITYELDDGVNGANPDKYTAEIGVSSFADASKEGYSFEGWYSDAEFKTVVTSIPSTQTGDVTLYAKFTINEYTINYVLDGGSNSEDNPGSYIYGEGVASFADASKEGYTFEGWYSDAEFKIQVTSITTTQLDDVTLYAKFVFIQLEGSGTVVINDLYYGEEIAPIITSSTNGTDNVIIQYKEKDADDDTYTYIKPSTVGEYTVRVVFAETEEYLQVTATDDFVISYLSEPDSSLSFNGTLGENDFYTSSVFILPLEGYLISDSLDGNYTDKLEIIQTTNLFLVYLKNTATGATTDGINVSEIKIDSAVPVISNAASGDVIYGEYAQITVTDDNLSQVMVNGSAVDFEDGEAVLLLYSNQGKEQYTITATDLAGNKSEISIVVAAEWMKTGVIPSGSKVKLYKGNAYTLGEGSWKIDGDDTVYAGNITFYVDEDGEYVFTKAE